MEGLEAESYMKDIIGMEESMARGWLSERGFRMRVVWRDGQDLIVTTDYWADRVNVNVQDFKVVQIEGIG